MSQLEEELYAQLQLLKLPLPEREVGFHPARRWRFDMAYVEWKVAIEIEGGTRSGGRHVRPDGYERDVDKYNHAALYGWKVFRFTAQMVRDGRAVQMIERVLKEIPT